MFPVTTINHTNNSYLFNINEYVFKVWFIAGCFLLGTVIMIILLMSTNSTSNPMDLTQNAANEPIDSNTELASRLFRQLRHNDENPSQTLAYNRFPENHPGHLNLELRKKLVSILRHSVIAHQFRYGSSIGTLYIKNTNTPPDATPEITGVVLSAELNPTWVYR